MIKFDYVVDEIRVNGKESLAIENVRFTAQSLQRIPVCRW